MLSGLTRTCEIGLYNRDGQVASPFGTSWFKDENTLRNKLVWNSRRVQGFEIEDSSQGVAQQEDEEGFRRYT